MYLQYKNKTPAEDVLKNAYTVKSSFQAVLEINQGKLFHGENLDVLSSLLHEYQNKIDLIYLDPPFATGNIFRISNSRSATISSSKNHNVAYDDTMIDDEFLEFIRQRLIILKELLSDHGSIYLHIDYKIGHYIKIVMDEVFGKQNFRNDITRIKCNPKNFKRKGYGNIKDMILFYSKSENYIWNEPMENRSDGELNKLFNKIDKSGRRYTTNPIHAPGETLNGETGSEWKGLLPPPGRHWRYKPCELDKLDSLGLIEWSKNGVPRKIIYADEMDQKRVQDIWEIKDPQNTIYPTEKNISVLERIIKTSSNIDSIVLDPFAGSGTTLFAASKLSRKWVGIDSSIEAITVIRSRFDMSKRESTKPKPKKNTDYSQQIEVLL